MKPYRFIFASILCTFIVPLAGAKENITQQLLLKTDKSWDGVRYQAYPNGQPELSVVKITIPAHTTLPWHTHPMPNAAYILSGTLTVKTRDGRQQLLHKGDVLPEMVNTVHRGITGNERAELIVFYAGKKGQPLFSLESSSSKEHEKALDNEH